MEDAKKLELITEALEEEEGTLAPETVLADLDGWDSMGKLGLIVMIDEECGKPLKSDSIKGFVTVKDIMDFMG